ncbi:hypothetical protein Ddc_12356 [Ditylenchus destructor]|nr:hypothetical protein Ddc_12356 [Ditylenchus destructor]
MPLSSGRRLTDIRKRCENESQTIKVPTGAKMSGSSTEHYQQAFRCFSLDEKFACNDERCADASAHSTFSRVRFACVLKVEYADASEHSTFRTQAHLSSLEADFSSNEKQRNA